MLLPGALFTLCIRVATGREAQGWAFIAACHASAATPLAGALPLPVCRVLIGLQRPPYESEPPLVTFRRQAERGVRRHTCACGGAPYVCVGG